MKKMAIIGSGGAEKSTLVRQRSEDIPVYYLDAIYWKPDRTWEKIPGAGWEFFNWMQHFN